MQELKSILRGLNCELPNGTSYKAISETMRTPVGLWGRAVLLGYFHVSS